MQGPIRRLVNPPVSSREAFAELDARKAARQATGDIAVPHEPSAAERVAEHTGHDEYVLADAIADRLAELGVRLTSGERLSIVPVIQAHRSGS